MTMRTIDISGRAAVVPASQPAPVLSWIPIADLVIDDSYQRPLGPRNWMAIERIAAAFSWARFAPVLVSPVAGGKYAVIDGQHRCHAAALCGFDAVPACAVPIAPAGQAEAFAAVNTAVTRMTPQNVYKARLAAGDALIVRVDDIVSAAGCRVLTYHPSAALRKPGELVCVALLERLVKGGRAVELGAVLRGLRACAEGTASTDVWCEAVLNAAVMAAHDAGVGQRDLAGFFDAHPPLGIIAQADRLLRTGQFGDVPPPAFRRKSMATLMRAWSGRGRVAA
jgi:hypothetical protein